MTGRDMVESDGGRFRTRRQVLTSVGAAGVIGLAGCSGGDGGDGDDGGATDGDENTTTVGVALPTTGDASSEGEELMAGIELARDHLNDGSGLASGGVISEDLGGGILGNEIELVSEDTTSTATGAKESGQALVAEQNADVLVGGASSTEARGLMDVASTESTVYMAGFAPSQKIGGENCSKYGFNEMFNTKMLGQALAPVFQNEFGSDVLFTQIYPRSTIGQEMFSAVEDPLVNVAGWRTQPPQETRVGTTDYTSAIQDALEVGPDVIVLNFLGLDGATALRQAKEEVPEDVDIAVSLFNRPMARNAGGELEGIVGGVPWTIAIDNEVTNQFASAWADDAGAGELANPSGLAHLGYMQLFQYAAAAERAGSLDADSVVSELEGHEYDVGLGQSTMRGCDHQAVKSVPVVEGLPASSQQNGKYFQMRNLATNVGYSCDEVPASNCSL